MKILVTGATGMIGSAVMRRFSQKHNVLGLARKNSDVSIDLTNTRDIGDFLQNNKPDVLVHLAAMSDINLAQRNPHSAWEINVNSVEVIVAFCKMIGIKLVLASTVAVFDGKSKTAYLEDDTRNPINDYGLHKMKAEDIASKLDDALIIRLPRTYGPLNEASTGVYQKLVTALKNGKPIEVTANAQNNPISTDNVAKSMDLLLQKNENGIFHIAGNEIVSIKEFGETIANILGADRNLVIESTTDFGVPRPLNGTLSNQKLLQATGIIPPELKEDLRQYLL